MQPPQPHLRINLADLKAQLVSKLGPEGYKQYFYCLNRFLSSKLSKSEFDRLCVAIVGRENIALHNQLIRSILKNACTATVPPPKYGSKLSKSAVVISNRGPSSDVFAKNESHPPLVQASNPPTLSNGDILPISLRKARTGTRERRGCDRRSAVAPISKTSFSVPQSTTILGEDIPYDNGTLFPHDIQSGVQHHQGLMQDTLNKGDNLGHHPSQLLENARVPDGPVSVHSTDQIEMLVKKEERGLSARSLLSAPLGIPLCHDSVCGTLRNFLLSSSSRCVTAIDSDSLLDTATLKVRMEQIAERQGLEGVSLDSANVLNHAVGFYLKGLITSCIELVGSRSGQEPLNRITHKNLICRKLVNGLKPGYHCQMHSNSHSLDALQENRFHNSVSLLDVRVAMELNQWQLGGDWPLLMEKICMHSFEK